MPRWVVLIDTHWVKITYIRGQSWLLWPSVWTDQDAVVIPPKRDHATACPFAHAMPMHWSFHNTVSDEEKTEDTCEESIFYSCDCHIITLITTNTQTADAGLDTWHWRESDHFCFAWIKIISHFLEHKINFNKEPLKHLQTCSTLNYLKLLQGIWTAGKIYWYVGIQGSIDHFFKQKVSQSFFRNELLTLHSC